MVLRSVFIISNREISNPKSKYVAYLSVLSQISNCQGLGRKNKHEILKTDRTYVALSMLAFAGKRMTYTVLYIYIYIYTHTYTYIEREYTYIYIYIYLKTDRIPYLNLLEADAPGDAE